MPCLSSSCGKLFHFLHFQCNLASNQSLTRLSCLPAEECFLLPPEKVLIYPSYLSKRISQRGARSLPGEARDQNGKVSLRFEESRAALQSKPMKRKLTIFQYGSEVHPIEPTRYSPSDWLEFSLSESSPSERSCSMGAPKASDSYASDASNSSLDLDSNMGDVHSITAPPEASFFQICREFDHLMATTEKRLPPQWSLPEFSRSVIGEEGVQDPTYLTNVCSDLSQHALQSWYWEEASQFLTWVGKVQVK